MLREREREREKVYDHVPPSYSYCKGRTLYTYTHVWCESFALERSINIGRQMAQAMGYLHARGIVHKDLNTKNVFLEKDRVIITDTGLSSLSDNIWIQ